MPPSAVVTARRAVRFVWRGVSHSSTRPSSAAAFSSLASSATEPTTPTVAAAAMHLSSPAASSAAAASTYVPRWQYAPSSTRRPSRSEVLHTYHSLLRLVRKAAQGQQQLWAKQRSEHWQGAPQQAGRSAAALFEYSDRWLDDVRQQYRAHRHETDERLIGILQSDAVEYAALLEANIQHSREVYEAGWGMQQGTKAHVSNTARRVGLEVSDSLLDREVEAELREEAKERGEDEWNVDETIARLEAVERRKKKEQGTKASKTAAASTPVADTIARNDK